MLLPFAFTSHLHNFFVRRHKMEESMAYPALGVTLRKKSLKMGLLSSFPALTNITSSGKLRRSLQGIKARDVTAQQKIQVRFLSLAELPVFPEGLEVCVVFSLDVA